MYVISRSRRQAWMKCHIPIPYPSPSPPTITTVRSGSASLTPVPNGTARPWSVSAAYPSIYWLDFPLQPTHETITRLCDGIQSSLKAFLIAMMMRKSPHHGHHWMLLSQLRIRIILWEYRNLPYKMAINHIFWDDLSQVPIYISVRILW